MSTKESCNKRKCWAITEDWHFCQHSRSPRKPFCRQHSTRRYVLGRLGGGTLLILGSIASIVGVYLAYQTNDSGGNISVSTNRANSADSEMTYTEVDRIGRNTQQVNTNSEADKLSSSESKQEQGESMNNSTVVPTQDIVRDKNEAIRRPKQSTSLTNAERAIILREMYKPTTREQVLKEMYKPTPREEILNKMYAASAGTEKSQ